MTELIPGPPQGRYPSQPGAPIVIAFVMAVVSVLGVAAVIVVRASGAYPSQASMIIPDVPFAQPTLLQVAAPDPGLANSPAVAAMRLSVLKVHGVAPSCQKVLGGSGFVVAPHVVMSAAHNVAGAATVTVEGGGRPYDASVVSYDPYEDIAILDVPGLPSPPLHFDTQEARSGSDAVLLGYPGGGDFTATPARIREVIELSGPDLYHSTTVSREVYTVRGAVRQGNSGGPLVDRHGSVLGVVFAAAVDDADVGFALTASGVSAQMAKATSKAAVATGTCVAEH